MALYHLDCISFVVWFSCLGHEDLFFCTLSVWACEILPSFYSLWNIIRCWGSVTGWELVWRQSHWALQDSQWVRNAVTQREHLVDHALLLSPLVQFAQKRDRRLSWWSSWCSVALCGELHCSSVMHSPLFFFSPLFSVCNHLLTFRLQEFHVISPLLSLVNAKLSLIPEQPEEELEGAGNLRGLNPSNHIR